MLVQTFQNWQIWHEITSGSHMDASNPLRCAVKNTPYAVFTKQVYYLTYMYEQTFQIWHDITFGSRMDSRRSEAFNIHILDIVPLEVIFLHKISRFSESPVCFQHKYTFVPRLLLSRSSPIWKALMIFILLTPANQTYPHFPPTHHTALMWHISPRTKPRLYRIVASLTWLIWVQSDLLSP